MYNYPVKVGVNVIDIRRCIIEMWKAERFDHRSRRTFSRNAPVYALGDVLIIRRHRNI